MSIETCLNPNKLGLLNAHFARNLGDLTQGYNIIREKKSKFARLDPCHKGCEGKEGECAVATLPSILLLPSMPRRPSYNRVGV